MINRKMDSFNYLTKELNEIGSKVQLNIIQEIELKKIILSIGADIVNSSIYLRLDLDLIVGNADSIFFDNDIINIKMDEEKIYVSCVLYSDYGIDNIMSLETNIYELEKSIFDKLEKSIIAGIKEHVFYYIDSIKG